LAGQVAADFKDGRRSFGRFLQEGHEVDERSEKGSSLKCTEYGFARQSDKKCEHGQENADARKAPFPQTGN